MESRPHGAEREVERRRDLLVREALEVPEHDHDPSLLGQLGDRALERRLELAPLGVRRRIGVGPPAPTWGGMLSGSGRSFMYYAPWMALFPAAAISLAVFGFNMLGDALRDVLDPRLRGAGGLRG